MRVEEADYTLFEVVGQERRELRVGVWQVAQLEQPELFFLYIQFYRMFRPYLIVV